MLLFEFLGIRRFGSVVLIPTFFNGVVPLACSLGVSVGLQGHRHVEPISCRQQPRSRDSL